LSVLYSKYEKCTASVRRGFAKTSADLFLNSDVANGKGGVWEGIFHLLLFLFWRNSGRTKNRKIKSNMDALAEMSEAQMQMRLHNLILIF